MKRLKLGLINLLTFVVLVAALIAWTMLPLTGALALAVLLASWLLLTRSGRQALAITGVGLSSLPQRRGASAVVVVGIAGVVGVLVAMLAMGEGFEHTLQPRGSADTAIVLRSGSQVETNSVINREQIAILASLPGIRRDEGGEALLSAELSQVASLPGRDDGIEANVQIRGVGDDAWQLRPHVDLIEGRRFTSGRRELIVGELAASRFAGLEVGRTIELANQEWAVVGMFRSGDSHDSELWADAESLASTYQRSAFQSATLELDGAAGFAAFESAIEADPRLKLEVQSTRDYYAKQSEITTRLIKILGTMVAAIMAIGAAFGALNTMYAAVAGRAREIATMRALGFGGLPLVAAVMLETMLLAGLGGALGAFAAWAAFHGYSGSTLGANFSQVVFQFRVSPELLWNGLKWAMAIGLVGGLFPALRAARLPVTDALRGS